MRRHKQSTDVTIVLPGITSGGAERVVTTVVNDWSMRGLSICVVLLTKDQIRFYDLNSQIEVIELNDDDLSRYSFLMRKDSLRYFILLRRFLKVRLPNTLIAFLPALNVISILATINLPIKTIVSERNDIRMRKIPIFWRMMRRILYRFADLVTINLSTNRQLLEQYVPSEKIVYLPNPVHLPHVPKQQRDRKKNILSVGRLTYQKGYDVLIPAYAKSKCRLCGWTLLIVGDGEEQGRLNNMTEHLGLQLSTFIQPSIKDLWLQHGDDSIFVMPSRFEGMPNALLEAIAHGLVPLVSDGVGDLADLISQIDERLVFPTNSQVDLTSALDWLAVEKLDKGQECPQILSVLEPYIFENSIGLWDNLVIDLLDRQ